MRDTSQHCSPRSCANPVPAFWHARYACTACIGRDGSIGAMFHSASALSAVRAARRFLTVAGPLLLLVLLGAFALRDGYNDATVDATPVQGDARHYVNYAINLLEHRTFSRDTRGVPPIPDAYWAPGYPAFLAGCFIMAESMKIDPGLTVLGLQLVLGLFSVFLTFTLARQFLPGVWPLLPAALVSLSPHLVAIGRNLLTETLFCFLLLLTLNAFAEACRTGRTRTWLMTGVAAAMAWLVNPVSLLMAPVLGLVAWLRGSRARSMQLGHVVGLVLPLVVCVLLWEMRTASVVPEDSSKSADRLMINLVIGMHSDYHERWRADKRDPANPADLDNRKIDGSFSTFMELWAERFLQQPGSMLRWYLLQKPRDLWEWEVKVGWQDIYIYPVLTSFYEQPGAARATYWAMRYSHWPLVILAVLGIGLLHRSNGAANTALTATYASLVYICAVYVITQADPRYSIPLRPLLYVCSAFVIYQVTRSSGLLPTSK